MHRRTLEAIKFALVTPLLHKDKVQWEWDTKQMLEGGILSVLDTQTTLEETFQSELEETSVFPVSILFTWVQMDQQTLNNLF